MIVSDALSSLGFTLSSPPALFLSDLACATAPVNLRGTLPPVPVGVFGRELVSLRAVRRVIERRTTAVLSVCDRLQVSRIHATAMRAFGATTAGLVRCVARMVELKTVRDRANKVLVSPAVSAYLPPVYVEGIGIAVIVKMAGPKPASIVSLFDKAEESFFGGQKASVVVTLCEHWKVVLSGVMRRAVSAAPPRFILRDSSALSGSAA